MTNTAAAQIKLITQGLPQLAVVQRKIRNPHLSQVYLDTGMGPKGPWVAFGINDKEYILGFK